MTPLNDNPTVNDQGIYEKLTRIFRSTFEDNSILLRAETSASDIAGWDSFSNAGLIAAIEKEFGIRFRTAELQTLSAVGSFVDLIRTKIHGQGGTA